MKNNLSFSVSVQKAKEEIIRATNSAMIKYQLPVFAVDGILCGIVAELRAQNAIDLANECEGLMRQLEALQLEEKEDNADG